MTNVETTSLEIPLCQEVIRKDISDHRFTDNAVKILNELNGRFRDMVAAVIDVHKPRYGDNRELRSKFKGMTVNIVREKEGNVKLVCENVPLDCVNRLPGNNGVLITRGQAEMISAAVRDVLDPIEFNGKNSREISCQVKALVERTRLFDDDLFETSFVWGGHSLPNDRIGGENGYTEYGFAREVGHMDALYTRAQFVTGCGAGIMKAPFRGASAAYQHERISGQRYIGFTEKNILSAEAPNNYVDRLVIFPDIEKRMEAFIRFSHRGRVHPGGAGTFEEIMTFLGVKMHPKNEGMRYPFDLVERPGGEYMRRVQGYLELCFKGELEGLYKIFHCEPKEYAEHLFQLGTKVEKKWNDELYYPEEIQKPFEVSFDSVESLDLSRDQSPFDLMSNLRRFYSAIVYLDIKNPRMAESWGSDLPRVKGDRDILEATDAIMNWFKTVGRLGKSYNKPVYRIA